MSDCSLLTPHFEYPPKVGYIYSGIWLLHSSCHVKLLPSRRTFCVHHTTMHQFTASLVGSRIRRVHVRLTVTCHLPFWQNDRDLFRATAGTPGWNGYRCMTELHSRPFIAFQKILATKLIRPSASLCYNNNNNK